MKKMLVLLIVVGLFAVGCEDGKNGEMGIAGETGVMGLTGPSGEDSITCATGYTLESEFVSGTEGEIKLSCVADSTSDTTTP